MSIDEPISMYVPARNAASTLAECIAAIQHQTRPPDELFILLDERSGDETSAVARTTGVPIVPQRGSTLGAARNEAMKAATHRWVASCDSDVLVQPDWLEGLAERRPDGAAGIGGRTNERVMSPFDAWRALHMPHHWGDHAFRSPFMLVSEVLFDRDAVVAAGGYREDLNYHEDSELCQRLRAAGWALDYEPAAIATHQRRDTLRSVLDLRWKYAEYRQRHLLADLAGVTRKMAVNREYAVNTLSRSLCRGQEELAYISFLLFFHHLLVDLDASLRLHLDGTAPVCACRRLGLNAAASALAEEDAELAGWVYGGLYHALREAGNNRPVTEVPGWSSYIEAARAATISFWREVSAVRGTLVGSAAYVHGCAGRERAQPVLPPASDKIYIELESARAEPVLDRSFCERLQHTWPDAGELRLIGWAFAEEQQLAKTGQAASVERATVAVVPHLGKRPQPCAVFREIDPLLRRLIVCYRPPGRFIPGLEVASATDLAAAAAAAGWTIERFETLVGCTQLMLSRTSDAGWRIAPPLETIPSLH